MNGIPTNCMECKFKMPKADYESRGFYERCHCNWNGTGYRDHGRCLIYWQRNRPKHITPPDWCPLRKEQT